jgi:hypothetical protein
MVLIAANQTSGTEGFSWEKAGDAGAIEVPHHVAIKLLQIPGELFYVVQKEVKKIEKEVEAEVSKVEKVVKKTTLKEFKEQKEASISEDVSEAIDVASPTKRRSTKE